MAPRCGAEPGYVPWTDEDSLDVKISELVVEAQELERKHRRGEATWKDAHEVSGKANSIFYELAFKTFNRDPKGV